MKIVHDIEDVTPKKRQRPGVRGLNALAPADDSVGVTFQIERHVHQRCLESAKVNYRSLSQEIRFRLARDLEANP